MPFLVLVETVTQVKKKTIVNQNIFERVNKSPVLKCKKKQVLVQSRYVWTWYICFGVVSAVRDKRKCSKDPNRPEYISF